MKKYRITLSRKQLEKIYTLLNAEYTGLVIANAAESSKEFVGKILDDVVNKLK